MHTLRQTLVIDLTLQFRGIGLRGLALTLFLVAPVFAQSVNSKPVSVLTDASPTLNEMVNMAARVAAIRVINKTPVTSLGPQRAYSTPIEKHCGYEISAHVISGLKGEQNDFSFFYPSMDGKVEINGEYLVFVFFRNTKKLRSDLLPLGEILSEEEWSAVVCKSFYGDLYIPRAPVLVFPFSKANTLQSKRPELEVVYPSPIVWCREHAGLQRLRSVESRRGFHDGKSMLFFDWARIQKLIAEAGVSNNLDDAPPC